MSFFRICSILIFVVTAYVKQYLQTTLSVKLIYERPDVHRVFEKACCLKTPVGFSLNRLQTRLDSVFSLSLLSLSMLRSSASFRPSHFLSPPLPG